MLRRFSVAQFQLTRSRGARPECGNAVDKPRRFQLTRSRGARPFSRSAVAAADRFQLTRSRGARQWQPPIEALRFRFQLTRSRGARLTNSLMGIDEELHFNSRAHVERDNIRTGRICHARHFNSRAHVERDWYSSHPVTSSTSFQLTRSRGARQTGGWNGSKTP